MVFGWMGIRELSRAEGDAARPTGRRGGRYLINAPLTDVRVDLLDLEGVRRVYHSGTGGIPLEFQRKSVNGPCDGSGRQDGGLRSTLQLALIAVAPKLVAILNAIL